MEAGKRRLQGDTVREANSSEYDASRARIAVFSNGFSGYNF